MPAQGGGRLLERALFALAEKRASHCVAIAGVTGDYLLVLDPVTLAGARHRATFVPSRKIYSRYAGP